MGNRQLNYGPEAIAWDNARRRATRLAAYLRNTCTEAPFNEIAFVNDATRIFFEEEFYKLVA